MKHLLSSENNMLKEIAEKDLANKTTKFSKITQQYMEELNINKNSLMSRTNNQIKEMVRKKDIEKWREEKDSKTTLTIYNHFKVKISEENHLYDNSEESVLLFRSRTNTLPLNWRNRFKPNTVNADQLCPMCENEVETLQHFLLECENQMWIRNKYNLFNINDQIERLRGVLCFNGSLEGRKLLKELWEARRRKIQAEANI